MLYHLIFAEVFLSTTLCGLCDGQVLLAAGGRAGERGADCAAAAADNTPAPKWPALCISTATTPPLQDSVGTNSPLPWKVLEGWGVITDGFNLWGSQNEHGGKAVNFAWEVTEIINPAGAARPCCTDRYFIHHVIKRLLDCSRQGWYFVRWNEC